MEVPKTLTPISPEQAELVLSNAWTDKFRTSIPAKVLRLLLALFDLETGSGRLMAGYNFGNIKTTATEPSSVVYYVGPDDTPFDKFRVYRSAEDGALGLVTAIHRDSRAEWRAGLLSGDPVEFVRALKGLNGGLAYFTAPIERYQKTFLQRWDKYSHLEGAGEAQPPKGATVPAGGFFSSEQLRFLRELFCQPGARVPTLRYGSTGGLVELLQERLARKGHLELGPIGRPDGIFGPKTRAAVLSYRLQNALPSVAVVDLDMWNRVLS